MTRHFGLTQINADNLSRRTTLDGGASNTSSGSRGIDTQYFDAKNVIQLAAVKPTSGEHMPVVGPVQENPTPFSPRATALSNSRPLPDALFIRSEAPFEGSYLLQSSIDVVAASFWISYFLLWGGTLAYLIWLLFS